MNQETDEDKSYLITCAYLYHISLNMFSLHMQHLLYVEMIRLLYSVFLLQ